MIVATVFGGLFFLCEPETTFRQGFLYTVANLLGINPLNDYTPTKLATAAIIDTYVAVTSLVFFGIMLNVVNLFKIPLDLNHAIERKITKNKIAIPIIALCIVIPAWNMSLSALFGFVLAGIEKWPISDGFLYVFSNALYLGNPLTDVSPNTPSGALLDVLISSMAVGYMAIFADYVTTLNPAKFVRKWLRKYFGEAGIIDIETSPELYSLAGNNITSGADNPDVNETIKYEDEG